MALILCPECNKEISDQTVSCPHCGYPIKETMETPSQDEQIVVKQRTRNKLVFAICCAVISILLVVAIIMSFVNAHKKVLREEYIEDLKSFNLAVLDGAAQSESLANLTEAVWRNTIFKEKDPQTDPYTINPEYKGYKDSDSFNSDFNDSIQRLYATDDTKNAVASIKENQTKVEDYYKKLQNPPEDLTKHYELMESIFNDYLTFTNLAISPKGSLNTFSEEITKIDAVLLEKYRKLKLLLEDE